MSEAASVLVELALALGGLAVMLGAWPGRRRHRRSRKRPSLFNWLVFFVALRHVRRSSRTTRPDEPPTLRKRR